MVVCECYIDMLEMDNHLQASNIEERWVTVEHTESLEDISLDNDHPNQITCIGTQANPLVCQELTLILKNNLDIFSWSQEDMPRIDPSIMVHQLNVSPSFPPVQQKKRVFAQERDKAIAEEVQKLLDPGFIREVYNIDWLTNVIMVKNKWQMENVCGLHRPEQSMLEG